MLGRARDARRFLFRTHVGSRQRPLLDHALKFAWASVEDFCTNIDALLARVEIWRKTPAPLSGKFLAIVDVPQGVALPAMAFCSQSCVYRCSVARLVAARSDRAARMRALDHNAFKQKVPPA